MLLLKMKMQLLNLLSGKNSGNQNIKKHTDSENISGKNQDVEKFYFCLLGILFIGAIIRLILFLEFKKTLFYLYPVLDAEYYDKLAKNIAGGKIIQDTAFFMGPLYPYFLGIIYFIFGHSLAIPRIIQMIMGLINIVFIFFIGKRIFNSRYAGCAAAFMMMAYKPQLFFEQTLLMEVMVSFFILSDILLILWAFEGKSLYKWMAAGFVFGLSTLTRGNILLILPFAALWIIIIFYKIKLFKKGLIISLLFIISAFIGITPATIHNWISEKDFILITSNSGINLFIGNNEISKGEFFISDDFDFVSDMKGIRKASEELGRKDLKSSEISQYWKNRALKYIKENPKMFISSAFRKFYNFWGREEIPQLYIQDLMVEQIPFLKIPGVNFLIIGPLAIIGIVISFFHLSKEKILIIIFSFIYIISILPFFITDRYRLGIAPVLILFAAYSACLFFSLIKKKKFIFNIVFLIAFFILIQLFNNSEIRQKNVEKAQFLNSMGLCFLKDEKYAAAESYFKQSLAILQKASTMANLATLYLKNLNNNELAYEYMYKAVRIKPNNARFNYNMGLICIELERYDEALEYFNRAVDEPDIPKDLFHNIAMIYARKQDWVNAYKNMEIFLKYFPEEKKSFEFLIKFYKEAGEYKKGEDILKNYISKHPNDANSIFNLGIFYHIQGDTDKAEQYYKKALELSPQIKAAREALEKLKEK